VAEGQKINLAAAYLNDMANSWYQGQTKTWRFEVSWADFAEDLRDHFGEKNMTDVIEEFNKLRKNGLVIEYQVRFEELRSLMWNSQPTLTEQYFVTSFISGLKDELRPVIKMMMPSTVKQAADKARLQELALEAIFKKHNVLPSPSPPTSQPMGGNSWAVAVGLNLGPPKVTLVQPRIPPWSKVDNWDYVTNVGTGTAPTISVRGSCLIWKGRMRKKKR